MLTRFTRQMPSKLIGSSMCILGGTEIIGGVVVGKAIDYFGKVVGMLMVVVTQASALYVSYYANHARTSRDAWWIAAGLLGAADSGAITVAYAER